MAHPASAPDLHVTLKSVAGSSLRLPFARAPGSWTLEGDAPLPPRTAGFYAYSGVCLCRRVLTSGVALLVPCCEGTRGCRGWVHPQCAAVPSRHWAFVFSGAAGGAAAAEPYVCPACARGLRSVGEEDLEVLLPLPPPINPPPFEIEAFVGRRARRGAGGGAPLAEYLVKWAGRSHVHCTWETEESLGLHEQLAAATAQSDELSKVGAFSSDAFVPALARGAEDDSRWSLPDRLRRFRCAAQVAYVNDFIARVSADACLHTLCAAGVGEAEAARAAARVLGEVDGKGTSATALALAAAFPHQQPARNGRALALPFYRVTREQFAVSNEALRALAAQDEEELLSVEPSWTAVEAVWGATVPPGEDFFDAPPAGGAVDAERGGGAEGGAPGGGGAMPTVAPAGNDDEEWGYDSDDDDAPAPRGAGGAVMATATLAAAGAPPPSPPHADPNPNSPPHAELLPASAWPTPLYLVKWRGLPLSSSTWELSAVAGEDAVRAFRLAGVPHDGSLALRGALAGALPPFTPPAAVSLLARGGGGGGGAPPPRVPPLLGAPAPANAWGGGGGGGAPPPGPPAAALDALTAAAAGGALAAYASGSRGMMLPLPEPTQRLLASVAFLTALAGDAPACGGRRGPHLVVSAVEHAHVWERELRFAGRGVGGLGGRAGAVAAMLRAAAGEGGGAVPEAALNAARTAPLRVVHLSKSDAPSRGVIAELWWGSALPNEHALAALGGAAAPRAPHGGGGAPADAPALAPPEHPLLFAPPAGAADADAAAACPLTIAADVVIVSVDQLLYAKRERAGGSTMLSLLALPWDVIVVEDAMMAAARRGPGEGPSALAASPLGALSRRFTLALTGGPFVCGEQALVLETPRMLRAMRLRRGGGRGADPTKWVEYANTLHDERAALWDLLRELQPDAFCEDAGVGVSPPSATPRAAFFAAPVERLNAWAAGTCVPAALSSAALRPRSPVGAETREWDPRFRGAFKGARGGEGALTPLRPAAAAPRTRVVAVPLTGAQRERYRAALLEQALLLGAAQEARAAVQAAVACAIKEQAASTYAVKGRDAYMQLAPVLVDLISALTRACDGLRPLGWVGGSGSGSASGDAPLPPPLAPEELAANAKLAALAAELPALRARGRVVLFASHSGGVDLLAALAESSGALAWRADGRVSAAARDAAVGAWAVAPAGGGPLLLTTPGALSASAAPLAAASAVAFFSLRRGEYVETTLEALRHTIVAPLGPAEVLVFTTVGTVESAPLRRRRQSDHPVAWVDGAEAGGEEEEGGGAQPGAGAEGEGTAAAAAAAGVELVDPGLGRDFASSVVTGFDLETLLRLGTACLSGAGEVDDLERPDFWSAVLGQQLSSGAGDSEEEDGSAGEEDRDFEEDAGGAANGESGGGGGGSRRRRSEGSAARVTTGAKRGIKPGRENYHLKTDADYTKEQHAAAAAAGLRAITTTMPLPWVHGMLVKCGVPLPPPVKDKGGTVIRYTRRYLDTMLLEVRRKQRDEKAAEAVADPNAKNTAKVVNKLMQQMLDKIEALALPPGRVYPGGAVSAAAKKKRQREPSDVAPGGAEGDGDARAPPSPAGSPAAPPPRPKGRSSSKKEAAVSGGGGGGGGGGVEKPRQRRLRFSAYEAAVTRVKNELALRATGNFRTRVTPLNPDVILKIEAIREFAGKGPLDKDDYEKTNTCWHSIWQITTRLEMIELGQASEDITRARGDPTRELAAKAHFDKLSRAQGKSRDNFAPRYGSDNPIYHESVKREAEKAEAEKVRAAFAAAPRAAPVPHAAPAPKPTAEALRLKELESLKAAHAFAARLDISTSSGAYRQPGADAEI